MILSLGFIAFVTILHIVGKVSLLSLVQFTYCPEVLHVSRNLCRCMRWEKCTDASAACDAVARALMTSS